MEARIAEFDALQRAIEKAVVPTADGSEPAWQVSWDPDCGRYLVTSRPLQAGDVVFQERPFVVADAPSSGEEVLTAVAIALLEYSTLRELVLEQWSRADISLTRSRFAVDEATPRTAKLLREPSFDGDADAAAAFEAWTHRVFGERLIGTMEDMAWALGIASNNVHTAREPTRGLLGVLASMMAHDCSPSSVLEVGAANEGSLLTLRASRDLQAGSPLSISYVPISARASERRRMLSLQYGFLCVCQRMTTHGGARTLVWAVSDTASPPVHEHTTRALVRTGCEQEGRHE